MSSTKLLSASLVLAIASFSTFASAATTLTCKEKNIGTSEFRSEYTLTQKESGLEIIEKLFIRASNELYDETSRVVSRNLNDLDAIMNPGAGLIRIPEVSFKLSSDKQEYSKVTVSSFRQIEFSPSYRKGEAYVRVNRLTVRNAKEMKELDLNDAVWSVSSSDSALMVCTASP